MGCYFTLYNPGLKFVYKKDIVLNVIFIIICGFIEQVFPGGWTAIYVYLDNVGAWNLRTMNLDRWYLGQETYIRIINPEDHHQKTELPVPDNALFCGDLGHLQKYV